MGKRKEIKMYYETDRCEKCKHCLEFEKWDYTDVRSQGLKVTKMPYHLCMMFFRTEGGPVIWMYGIDKSKGLCEMFTERE